MNCHFPDLEEDYENDMDGAKEVRNAYMKGRVDLLFSLAEYGLIPMETASYLAGISSESFEDKLQDWRDAQKME